MGLKRLQLYDYSPTQQHGNPYFVFATLDETASNDFLVSIRTLSIQIKLFSFTEYYIKELKYLQIGVLLFISVWLNQSKLCSAIAEPPFLPQGLQTSTADPLDTDQSPHQLSHLSLGASGFCLLRTPQSSLSPHINYSPFFHRRCPSHPTSRAL